MKKNKTHLTLAAATTLALGAIVSLSSGDEHKPQPVPEMETVAKEDVATLHLNAKVIDPLNQQAKRRNQFSRKMPTYQTSYYLVEASKKSSAGKRSFIVMKKQKPFMKEAKETSSEYLQLRYLEKDHQILVNVKDTWIELDEHPILKSLIKIKPATKVKS